MSTQNPTSYGNPKSAPGDRRLLGLLVLIIFLMVSGLYGLEQQNQLTEVISDQQPDMPIEPEDPPTEENECAEFDDNLVFCFIIRNRINITILQIIIVIIFGAIRFRTSLMKV